MPSFKEDKLGCCAQGSTSFVAIAQPEPADAQIARRIRRCASYQQKRPKKQMTQHPTLQVSKKWVEKDRPDQVSTIQTVGKSKIRQKSATKIQVRQPVTRIVTRPWRYQEASPVPSSQGQQSNASSSPSSKRISSSPVTKTISSLESKGMNISVTNFEPPHNDVTTRIQKLEQCQQMIEAMMENHLLALQCQGNDEVPSNHQNEGHASPKKTLMISSPKQEKRIHSRKM